MAFNSNAYIFSSFLSSLLIVFKLTLISSLLVIYKLFAFIYLIKPFGDLYITPLLNWIELGNHQHRKVPYLVFCAISKVLYPLLLNATKWHNTRFVTKKELRPVTYKNIGLTHHGYSSSLLARFQQIIPITFFPQFFSAYVSYYKCTRQSRGITCPLYKL